MIRAELFGFAYIPTWFEQLYELSQMAEPEPWRYKQPEHITQNTITPILERYINRVFRQQAVAFNYAPVADADRYFYVRNEFACFHTGLYTRKLKNIYMCFERSKRPGAMRRWSFLGFEDDYAACFKYVQQLPERPEHPMRKNMKYYNPDWDVRVNADHILDDPVNMERLPVATRGTLNQPLMLETAVEMTRRKARNDWSLAVPQIFQGKIQYLLPIYLSNSQKPDLAMALSIMDGYYIGHTCLTLEMAYQNARMLARPNASWLTEIVE